MSKIGGWTFWIDLYGPDFQEIDSQAIEALLSVKVDDGRINVPDNINYSSFDNPSHYDEIIWLLDLIEPKVTELKKLGVCFGNSSVWVIYEYFAQCNMEYDANVLKRLGNLGLKLCVSCYEDTHLANRESFNRTLVHEPEEGVFLSTTIGVDVKIGDVFPLKVKVENMRKNHSFILTSIDIDKDFIRHFDIIKYSKQPKYVNIYSDIQSFEFDTIIKSDISQTIIIFLKAKEQGVFRGCIKICEGSQYIESGIVVVVEEKT